MVVVLDLDVITNIILVFIAAIVLSVLVICLWEWWDRQVVARLRPWQSRLKGMPWPKRAAFVLGTIVVMYGVTFALMWLVWGQR
jgi:hypothetical protein